MHTATLAETHTVCELSCMHGLFALCTVCISKSRTPASVCLASPGLSWVQNPIGPWSPGDLFLTEAWGILGVWSSGCESGWVQKRSLGVKKRRRMMQSLACARMCLQFGHFPSSPTLNFPLQREQFPALWAPASQAGSAFSPSWLSWQLVSTWERKLPT